jgi:ATP-dependent helicase/nuclease subunit A
MSEQTALDQEQRRRAATNLTVPICVEAAAGTGKTQLIEDRVAEIIGRGAARIDQVVAITFTEFAAAELRARIRARLSREAIAADSEASAYFRNALGALDNTSIETIHAFAAGLLRERPVEARIDPRFEVLDELGMQIDFDNAWDEWFGRRVEEEPEPVERILSLGFPLAQVRKLAEVLNRNRDVRPLDHPSPPVLDLESYWRELTEALKELQGLAKSCRNTEDYGFRQIMDIADYHARLAAATPDEALYIIASDFDIKPKGARPNWDAASSCDRQKEICDGLRTSQQSARQQVRSRALADLLRWLEPFPEWYDERRRLSGKLDFDDLLVRARNLLRDDRSVRRYFQDRYKFILVDEFQDTDPLQIEIVFFLCEKPGDTAERWQDVLLDGGKLFVVGDPKQSIYRFRRADIAMYDEAREVIGKQGEVIDVFQNFRCADQIVEWTNEVFSQRMDGRQSVQARYIPLVSWPARQRDLNGDKLSVLAPAGQVEGTRAHDLRRAEARSIASLIETRMVDRWEIEDPERPGHLRKVEHGDIVVLVPTRTSIDLFEQIFQDRGLIYRHEGGGMFYRRQEVRDLIAYLTALDNPSDELAVVATLRHVYGIADEDLLLYKSRGGRFDFRQPPPGGCAPIADAFDEMLALYARRNEGSLAGFVDLVIARSGLIELHELLPQGRQAVANVGKVGQLARQFQGQPAATLHKFVRWLRANRDENARESDSASAESSDQEVRILTVHMAKGLEFPVVIVANLGTAFSRRDQEFVDRRTRQIHFKRSAEGTFTTPDFDEASAHERERYDAERARCLYVACTRARDHLVISAFGKNEGSWLSLLSPWLDKLPRIDSREFSGIEAPIGYVAPEPVDVTVLVAARSTWQEQRASLLANPAHLEIITATEQRQLSRPEQDPLPRSPLSSAARKGIVLHSVLELFDPRDWDELVLTGVESVCGEAGVADEAEEILAMTLGVLRSPLLRRAVDCGRYWREVPFALPLDNMLLEGSIDLLFEEEDGLVIVDYKSDDVSESETDARAMDYRGQAALYTLACRKITDLRVKEFIIYFARPGVTVSLDSQLLEDEGRRLLGELAASYPPARDTPAA